jgi:transposase
MISGLEPSWTALVARVVATAKIKPQCSQILEEGVQNERLIAVGRRNWTFAGSDAGGRRAAALYTLIETAKLNDVDPRAWLADVLTRLPDHPALRLHELLPWAWKPGQIRPAAA